MGYNFLCHVIPFQPDFLPVFLPSPLISSIRPYRICTSSPSNPHLHLTLLISTDSQSIHHSLYLKHRSTTTPSFSLPACMCTHANTFLKNRPLCLISGSHTWNCFLQVGLWDSLAPSCESLLGAPMPPYSSPTWHWLQLSGALYLSISTAGLRR